MQHEMKRGKARVEGDRRRDRGKIRRCQSCKIYMGPQLPGLSSREEVGCGGGGD